MNEVSPGRGDSRGGRLEGEIILADSIPDPDPDIP